ncbi:nitrilase-related carbon-nitrogen hydrolase [Cupriavidus necator]|uniref:nitrilase-related carbon-nitrogen hydrolase n=1 Tax=Cupriavidus necator TaxID=106590 RepID=UPI0009B8CBCB|nr:nitrilase-related carbon-nitrogen hydrolase [Cupriavidus necator]
MTAIPAPLQPVETDAVIVGAGPVGLFHVSFSAYEPYAHALGWEVNNAISRVYAVEGSCFVLAPCAVISEAMIDELCDTQDKHQLVRAGGGHAVIYGPDGSPLCDKLAQDEEGLLYADIDLGAIGVAKNAMDPVGHYSRPDVHRLLLNTRKGNRVERFSLPLDSETPHEEASNA